MIEINKVGYESDDLQEKASLLSKQLDYKLDKKASSCLFVSKKKLALKIEHFSSLLYADFSKTTWEKRRGEGKKQGLIRVCKPVKGMTIIDATAGWGRDASILSSYGAKVLMLERHPLMMTLLEDALSRHREAENHPLDLSLIKVDALTYLSSLTPSQYPDLIYIDPMHPERSKSALVKKEFQVLQQLIGTDKDVLNTLECAIHRARQRVVVKWPQKLKPLLQPNFSCEGKTIRFDVYLAHSKPA